MAKINFSFDTMTKELVADINGSVLNSVRGVNIYKYDDKYELSLDLDIQKGDGMKVVTYITAKKK